MKRILFPFLAFSLLPQAIAAIQTSQLTQPALAATLQSTPEATASIADDADSIVLPDGTPIPIKVVNGFSSADAKVGDVIQFAVAFEVREGGVVAPAVAAAVAAAQPFQESLSVGELQ